MTRLSLLAVAVLAIAAVAVAEPITELTITERHGIARDNEPIRMGVPLPKGLIRDAGELALTDAAGTPIPVQADPAMTWGDGSIRWAHLSFVASVPAKGQAVVKLVKGKPAQSDAPLGAGTDWKAVRHVGVIDVELEATIDGESYSIRGGKSEMPVRGGECSVMSATGRLTGKSGKEGLDVTIYMARFAGSPDVLLSVSYTNKLGAKPADHVKVEDLALVIKTDLKAGKFMLGGDGKVHAGQLAADESASVLATDSKSIVVKKGDEELAKFNPLADKPLTVGWGALQNDTAGLAVGCRWFWQTWPKDVTVGGDGTIRIGLYSSKAAGKPLDCYLGQGRTHYITLRPFAAADAGKVADAMAAVQVPLRAVAPPAWYCQQTEGFGKVAASDPALYPADLADALKKYDASLRDSLDYIVKKKDGHTYNGVTMDSFGYNAWGDVFHWANDKGNTDPHNILWESNYYDFPYACFLQFARTGDEAFLDVADPHGLHLADVFMCKWHPSERLVGACRYSPPADHVGLDKSPASFTPYVSVEFNHHKAQSILARYLLLGDLRAKDDFLLALNNALKNPEESWRQCRGPGAKLATLYWGYQLTHDKACLNVMQRIITKANNIKDAKGFSKQGKSGYFMMGIAREGMLYWAWETGDKDAVATMKMITDFLLDGGGKVQGPQDAYPLAVCYRLTGEQKYRDAAVKLLDRKKLENRPKGFGMDWRSTPYAWYYLSNLVEKDTN